MTRFLRRRKVLLCSALARVRPPQLGDILKRLLRVRRRVIETRHGCRFWLDPASHFGYFVLRDGVYERSQTELVLGLLRPDDTFIDVGANEGYFSILASSVLPAGRVHCIEPQSRLQPVIRTNIRLNGASRVVLHRLALSDRVGTVELHLWPSTNTGSSSVFRHWKISSSRETVPAATLDAFFERNSLEEVRLLKMDCEGAEGLIVSGGAKVFGERRVQFAYIEYHPVIIGERSCLQVHERMRGSGYCFTRIARLGLGVYHRPQAARELETFGELEVDCDPTFG